MCFHTQGEAFYSFLPFLSPGLVRLLIWLCLQWTVKNQIKDQIYSYSRREYIWMLNWFYLVIIQKLALTFNICWLSPQLGALAHLQWVVKTRLSPQKLHVQSTVDNTSMLAWHSYMLYMNINLSMIRQKRFFYNFRDSWRETMVLFSTFLFKEMLSH